MKMQLFGTIEKVEEQSDGTIRVHGIASTETRDDQGEIVTSEAMKNALPDYLRFPALREMHQLQAAGTTLEADVGDDKVTRIVAHVVDPVAVSKVKNKVYRGFSIGGNVKARKSGDPKTITELNLTEISLVDRPANPEAVFEVWKAQTVTFEPVQVWSCGVAGHIHKQKGEALKCLEQQADPAHQDEQRKAYEAEQAERLAAITKADNKGAEVTQEGHEFGGDLTQMATAIAEALQRIEKGEIVEADKVHREPDPKDKPNAPMPKTPPDTQDGSEANDDDKRAGDDGGENEKEAGGDKPGDGSKPYGDVKYADPGYLSDGKKRYPIDTERHIRAAWGYINKPANSRKYTAEQLAHVKGAIRAAMKRIGAEVEDDGKAVRVSMRKALWDTGQIAGIIMDLDRLQEQLVNESAIEGDESPQPERLHAIITELCGFLNALVAEETAEIIAGNEIEGPGPIDSDGGYYGGPAQWAHAVEGLKAAAERGIKGADIMAELLKGARHSRENQAKLNLASYCVGKAMEDGAPAPDERVHLGETQKALLDAGAVAHQAATQWKDGDGTATEHSTVDTGRNGQTKAPQGTGPQSPTPGGDSLDMRGKAFDPAVIMLDVMLKAAGTNHSMHLMVAHKCMKDMTGGDCCKASMKAATFEDLQKSEGYEAGLAKRAELAKMSKADMAHMDKAHFHLTKVDGCGKCDAIGGSEMGSDMEASKTEQPDDLVKTIAAAIASALKPTDPEPPVVKQADLAKTIAEAVAAAMPKAPAPKVEPEIKTAVAGEDLAKALQVVMAPFAAQLSALAADVKSVKDTPLPSQTVAADVLPPGILAIAKGRDGRLLSTDVDSEQLTPEQIQKALSMMSQDEQTLMLIKASRNQPLNPLVTGGVSARQGIER